MDTAQVTLPGGCWLDGVRHQMAELRPLVGDDEVFLLEAAGSLTAAQTTTALLARCLVRLGPLDDVTPRTVRALTIGDREALLLHLRRVTLGNQLQGELACPAAGCGQKMDLPLRVSDFLLDPDPDRRERYDLTFTDDGSRYQVWFRLPTGADAEDAAAVAARNPERAADQLLERCVEAVTADGGGRVEPREGLPPAVRRQLPATLLELDPQAEVRLNVTCPECGHRFRALLDAGSVLFREVATSEHRLYRDVHLLAFYYHWSEAAILSMTATKRRRYLGLLAEALAH